LAGNALAYYEYSNFRHKIFYNIGLRPKAYSEESEQKHSYSISLQVPAAGFEPLMSGLRVELATTVLLLHNQKHSQHSFVTKNDFFCILKIS
jgi:hypothetical protein